MKKHMLLAALLSMLLFSALAGIWQGGLVSAQFSGSVIIAADGRVDPADAPVHRAGDIYTVTGDLSRIKVDRSNVILDGNGHTLSGGSGRIVVLEGVRNVVVKNLTVVGGKIGVYLDHCFNVTLTGNNITETSFFLPQLQATAGVYVWGGSNHIISGNYISKNFAGIYLGYDVFHTDIVDNDITGNSRGISLWESSFNCVFGNNFVNNSIQVRDSGADYPDWHISMNSWDDGSKGNFWSDYSGSDVYGDCIGDVPYVVYEGNQDNYPLMAPVVREPIAPLHVSVFNPINSTYNDTSVHLVFAVDKQVEWVGYSLDRQENVTAAGNVTLAGLSDGVHTLTVYANDTFGFTGASETIVFTVATFPTNLVAAIIVVTTAVVAIGLLFYFKKRKH